MTGLAPFVGTATSAVALIDIIASATPAAAKLPKNLVLLIWPISLLKKPS
jgi:hypothetical protein